MTLERAVEQYVAARREAEQQIRATDAAMKLARARLKRLEAKQRRAFDAIERAMPEEDEETDVVDVLERLHATRIGEDQLEDALVLREFPKATPNAATVLKALG